MRYSPTCQSSARSPRRGARPGQTRCGGLSATASRSSPVAEPTAANSPVGSTLAAMGDREDLRKFITDLAVVHGRVTLSSGRRRTGTSTSVGVTLHHAAAPLVGRVMLDLTADWEYDAVGGLTLGADPVAVA